MAARRAGAPVLIGGIVLDVQARAAGPGDVQRGGSVPGHVRQAPGGVARNVAHALAALTRTAPLLVSAVGDDAAGAWLLAHWAGRGLPTHGIRRVAGAATPCVSIVFDRGGEVAAAVADVGLLERELTPELVRRHVPAIRAAPALLVDGNLQPLAIAEACAAAAAAGVPVVFEPVSAAKAARAARALHCIDILTPNAAELAALAAEVRRGRGGALAAGGASPAPAAGGAPSGPVAGSGGAPAGREAAAAALAAALPDLQAVLGAGAAHVLLTLGPLGAALCRLGRRGACGAVLVAHMPALPAEVANCLGAGDCLAAGVLMRLMEGGSPVDALAHGLGSYERPALPA